MSGGSKNIDNVTVNPAVLEKKKSPEPEKPRWSGRPEMRATNSKPNSNPKASACDPIRRTN